MNICESAILNESISTNFEAMEEDGLHGKIQQKKTSIFIFLIYLLLSPRITWYEVPRLLLLIVRLG